MLSGRLTKRNLFVLSVECVYCAMSIYFFMRVFMYSHNLVFCFVRSLPYCNVLLTYTVSILRYRAPVFPYFLSGIGNTFVFILWCPESHLHVKIDSNG